MPRRETIAPADFKDMRPPIITASPQYLTDYSGNQMILLAFSTPILGCW